MRVLKLYVTTEQYETVRASCLLAYDAKTEGKNELFWLGELLTAACQKRIDEVMLAAKGVKASV